MLRFLFLENSSSITEMVLFMPLSTSRTYPNIAAKESIQNNISICINIYRKVKTSGFCQ